ncbi:MAG: hypothetical protein ACT6UH_22470 [Hydrogenophaga sp.]|uniref:hypothetical protein n=1 Tax=Hydrogenophaga sp. TaxID=1904254 RepID=UPI004034F7D3
MQNSKKPSTLPRVALRLLIASYFIIPIVTGWQAVNRVDCSYCLGDMLHHYFSVFGYIVLGVYLVSFTQPSRHHDDEQARPNIAFREDLQFWGVLGGLAVSAYFFVVSFNWDLFFL